MLSPECTVDSAGNTGRHTSHVETLQAAAYGSIDTLLYAYGAAFPPRKPCGCMTLSCPHEPDPLGLATQSANGAEAVTSQRRESERDWVLEIPCEVCGAGADKPCKPTCDGLAVSEYVVHGAQSNYPEKPDSSNDESAQSLSRAMSQPLDHSPRLGALTR